MRSLGLYIHIPFCKAKCIYCDFYSLPRAEGQMDAYVSALTVQLAAWRERAADCTVDTVYFGGGTPSYLGPDRLRRLLDAVFQSYRVAPGAEITLEANPDSAQDISALRQLHDAGFDRLSLGMQSADDAELRRIGRVHTHAQTVRAVENARAAGFDNLSLDLIYGLPEQTMTRWQANLDAALSLAPEHLSCYGLKVEEGTPLFAQRERFTLPDDDTQADMYLSVVGLLARRGYEQYEISNFCRPGRRPATTAVTGRSRNTSASAPARTVTSAASALRSRAISTPTLRDTPSIPSAPRPRRVSGRPSASCSRSARPAASPRIRCQKPRGAFSGIVKPTASPIFPAAFMPSRPAAFWSPTPSLSIFWKQWSFDGTFFRLSSSLLLRAVMV